MQATLSLVVFASLGIVALGHPTPASNGGHLQSAATTRTAKIGSTTSENLRRRPSTNQRTITVESEPLQEYFHRGMLDHHGRRIQEANETFKLVDGIVRDELGHISSRVLTHAGQAIKHAKIAYIGGGSRATTTASTTATGEHSINPTEANKKAFEHANEAALAVASYLPVVSMAFENSMVHKEQMDKHTGALEIHANRLKTMQ